MWHRGARPAVQDQPAIDDAEPPHGNAPSRVLAVVAFILVVTSLWLPWWRVTYEDSGGRPYDTQDVGVFGGEHLLAHSWARWVTAALAVGATLLLFVRIAGRSWTYEPGIWRRDLGVAALLCGLALASCLLWPSQVPSFWGGRTFALDNATGTFSEFAMPGLGWWVALLAALLAGLARWKAPLPTTAK